MPRPRRGNSVETGGRLRYHGVVQTGQNIAAEYGVAQGLFKGLVFRVALISTTFFLVNAFKERTVPLLFPHAVRDKRAAASGGR